MVSHGKPTSCTFSSPCRLCIDESIGRCIWHGNVVRSKALTLLSTPLPSTPPPFPPCDAASGFITGRTANLASPVDERVQTKQSTICRQRLHMVALCWDKMPLTSINNVLLKHLSAAGIETKFQRAGDLRYDAICPICFVLAEMVISKSLKWYLMLDFSSKTEDPESHQVIKRCLHVSIQPLYLSKSAKLSETKDKQTSIHRSDIYIQHTMSEDFRVTMEITSTQKKTRLGVWSNAKTLSLNPERWFFERNSLYCLRQS